MEQFKNIRRVDLETGEPAAFSVRQLYYADKKANRVGAMVYANGDPVALTGTCSGTAIRADGTTVPMTGAISGNTAYVDLIQDCYAIEGEIRIFVKITSGNVTATLAAAVGNVRLTETNAVIDPGTIIPSVSALISAIDDAIASIPADYSDLLAAIAPVYTDLTFPVKKGRFCLNGGVLYAANQDIATSENWTASHWNTAVLGNELAGRVDELKSALNVVENAVVFESSVAIPLTWMRGALDTSTGAFDGTGNRQVSDYFAITQESFAVSVTSPLTGCMIYRYDAQKAYLGRTSWITSGTQDNVSAFYRISLRHAGASQVEESEIENFTITTAPVWKNQIGAINAKLTKLDKVLDTYAGGKTLLREGIYIKTDGTEGTYTSTADTKYYATDYIDCVGSTSVIIKTSLSSAAVIAIYTSGKTLSRIVTPATTAIDIETFNITLSGDERYIRSSFYWYDSRVSIDDFSFTVFINLIDKFNYLETQLNMSAPNNSAQARNKVVPLDKPTFIFIDDDGDSTFWETSEPIFSTAGIPLTVALGSASEINSDLASVKTWLANGNAIAQHALGTDQDLTQKTYSQLISWIETEQAYWYDNGLVVNNIVYGGSQWTEQLGWIASRYYNSGASIVNSRTGIGYRWNNPGTNRYALSRYPISGSYDLETIKGYITSFLADCETYGNGVMIFYSHSYQLSDATVAQRVTDLLAYMNILISSGVAVCRTMTDVFG